MDQCNDNPCLWILDNNDIACALYTKHGFLPTGNRHKLSDSLSEIELRLGKVADTRECMK